MSVDYPKFIAQVTFFPMGIFMGFLMYNMTLDPKNHEALSEIKYWPFVVASASALAISWIMEIVKSKSERFKFENFYFMAFGMLLLLIGSININDNDVAEGIYLSMAGHGICYISALTYINIRAASNRLFSISVSHLFYLGGIATAATVSSKAITAKTGFKDDLNERIGSLNTIVTGIVMGMYMLNQFVQYCCKGNYTYFKSMDMDLDRENKARQIFKNELFTVNGTVSVPKNYGPSKPSTFEFLGIFSKVQSVMCLYYPFFYINQYVLLQLTGSREFFVVNWMAMVGLLISMALIKKNTLRKVYVLSCLMKILIMVTVTLMSITYFPRNSMKVMMWILFLITGFGYSLADISILTFTRLKRQAFNLAVGYVVEMIVIGVIYYHSIYGTVIIFPSMNLSSADWFFKHAIAFSIVLLFLIMFAISTLPKFTVNSLLEMSNFITSRGLPPVTVSVQSPIVTEPPPPPQSQIQQPHIGTGYYQQPPWNTSLHSSNVMYFDPTQKQNFNYSGPAPPPPYAPTAPPSYP